MLSVLSLWPVNAPPTLELGDYILNIFSKLILLFWRPFTSDLFLKFLLTDFYFFAGLVLFFCIPVVDVYSSFKTYSSNFES